MPGCGPRGSERWRLELTRRASFDFDCPAETLEVVDLGTGTYGVTGCGCRATYRGYTGYRLEMDSMSGTCVSGIVPGAGGESTPAEGRAP